ncbi:Nodulation receptor kinase [Acorus calamus]|uniref:Nodulation receptor kinase n=1 Tax=Acorus calamus TaxID=4465 RepID=A0AAV9CJ99_ACOCL|nr:Nodulation receptor kinase [Acorus calamus]
MNPAINSPNISISSSTASQHSLKKGNLKPSEPGNLSASAPDTTAFTTSPTNKLSTSIGEGGFGTVYLGQKNDGTKIAVKILSQKSSQGTTEFQNEIEVLMKIQHENLVPFIVYCNDGVKRAII